jgi:hypothetical protein
LVSVSEEIHRPNYKPAIFLKSSRIAFCIREALDFWQKSAKRYVLSVLYTVKIDKVTQCSIGNAALDNFPAAVALKAHTLRLSFETSGHDAERHVQFLSPTGGGVGPSA